MITKTTNYKEAMRPRTSQRTPDLFRRAVTYSILIHVCIFIVATVYTYSHHLFAKPIRVDYSIQLEDVRTGSASGGKKVAAKVEKPKQPAPKPPEKKVAPPPEDKSVQVPKVEKIPPPKKTPKPEPKAPEEKKPEPRPEEKKTEVAMKEQPAQKPVPKPEPPPPPVDQFPDDFSVTQKVGPGGAESEISGPKSDGGSVNPELRWYVDLLRQKVRQKWIEPRYLLTPGAYARVVIRCEIGRDGTLASDPKVYESSTIPDFDQSGYRAVLRAAPFPPLPESLQRNIMGIRFSFEFGENA